MTIMKGIILICIFLLIPFTARAGITFTDGVWEETLSDCTSTFTASSDGQSLPCGNGTRVNSASGTPKQQLLRSANNPAGSGYGFTHPNCDGKNNPRGMGDWMIDWSGSYSEMWIRFYMNYPSGFTWGPFTGDKLLYFQHNDPAWTFQYHGGGQLKVLYVQGNEPQSGTNVWNAVHGGSTGDGEWHCYEIYFKINPGTNGDTVRIWVDEVLYVDEDNAGIDSEVPTAVVFAANQDSPNNGECVNILWDDIKIVVDPDWSGFKTDLHENKMIGKIEAGNPPNSPPDNPSDNPLDTPHVPTGLKILGE